MTDAHPIGKLLRSRQIAAKFSVRVFTVRNHRSI
jgi:DNA-binding CsgD family transcriptional regulator